MKTYVVTGGAGFIGSHICQALLQLGHRVINIDNFADFYDYTTKISNVLASTNSPQTFTYKEKNVDLHHLAKLVHSATYQLEIADIRDYQELDKIFQREHIDAVIHLAALAGVRPSIAQPLTYIDVNIQGTMVILELMRKYGIKQFVCASSSSVYGNNKKIPFSEDDIVDKAISPYAATKKSCEVIAHTYHHLYQINTILLRFFTVYGPRQRPDLAIHKFTKMILADTPISIFGDGNTMRDYTYIDDIIDGILSSITYLEQHQHVFEILNLGESQTISLREMIVTIEKYVQKKALKNYLPLQPGDVIRTYADTSKARTLIGYNPQTSFEEGIKRFIAWYKIMYP